GQYLSHLSKQHLYIRVTAHQPPYWFGNVGGRQRGGGNLIQQGLEQLIIVLIDQGDADGSSTETARHLGSRKTGTDNSDAPVHRMTALLESAGMSAALSGNASGCSKDARWTLKNGMGRYATQDQTGSSDYALPDWCPFSEKL